MKNEQIEEIRIEEIIHVIQKIASGNFSSRVQISDKHDIIDGIASGINMLCEEIESNMSYRDDQTKALLNMLEDVREAKEASERVRHELQESEEKYRTLFEGAPVGFAIVDLEGRITDCNDTAFEITGLQREEMVGKQFMELDLISEEDMKNMIESFMESIQGDIVRRKVLPINTKNGKKWVEAFNVPLIKGGEIYALQIIIQDITEKKQAEDALFKSEKKYRTLMDNLSDIVVETDADGNFTFISPQVTDTFGFKPEELVGKSAFDFIHPDDQEKVFEAMEQALQNSQLINFEYRTRHKDGHFVNVSSSGKLVEEGDDFKLVSVIRDITERKKAEEQLMDAMKKLKRANIELEQFNKVAYHDLQEPLRTISSYVQLLERRYKGKLDEDADLFLGYIAEGIKRMHRLINDLLSYSKVGTFHKPFEQIDSTKIIENVIYSLRPTIEEKDAVITYDPLPLVVVDNYQLFQLSKNLLSNALKFHGEDPPRVHVSAEQKESEWMFSVRDNGIGIDPKFTNRIFTIFQRLHSTGEYQGTGIGLAICKKIVENHGGRIWVESEHKKGSTFYFTIPKRRGDKL